MTADSQLVLLLEQANQISNLNDLEAMASQILIFLSGICKAPAAALYISVQGDLNHLPLRMDLNATFGPIDHPVQNISLEKGALYQSFMAGKVYIEDNLGKDNRNTLPDILGSNICSSSSNVAVIPLLGGDNCIGCMVAYDCDVLALSHVSLLANRLASDLGKLVKIHSQQHFINRLKDLVEFIGMIGSSLDRDEILRMIIRNARDLLGSEATSLFLVDEATGESVLKIASNVESLPIEEVRVPKAQGIIGAAIQSGSPVQVNDIAHDHRHYDKLDHDVGFITHSVLAVPMRTRPVTLGEEMGITEAKIIGALEAINKPGGIFSEVDTDLLRTLANQAGTVLKIAELYTNANELFLDIVKALAAAIDAKDPYTVGHSQRVSNFAVEIARQLNQSPEIIQQIRVGALLHDIGKIGIPDSILLKPGRLTSEEYDWMKKHPSVGENIMNQVRMLHNALPCLSEHHEKIDGTGYPRGLKGFQISLMGRIVAVADVFDAITSDRPYRPGMSVDEAFVIQQEGIGTHFDADCVYALKQAYLAGKIHLQTFRDMP